jgi:hypothetical protein
MNENKSSEVSASRHSSLDMAFCFGSGLLGAFWLFQASFIGPASFHSGLAGLVGFGSAFFVSASVIAFGFFSLVRILIRDKIRKEAVQAFSWPPSGLWASFRSINQVVEQCGPSGLRRPPRPFY